MVVAADAMVGPRSWFSGLFYRSGNKRQGGGEKDFTLTPIQVSYIIINHISFLKKIQLFHL